MKKQTVFIKRYPSNGELPNKAQTWVIANGTGLNYDKGVFKCPHSGEVQANIHWWLEEIELPSEYDMKNEELNAYGFKNKTTLPYTSLWENGANLILNKLKG